MLLASNDKPGGEWEVRGSGYGARALLDMTGVKVKLKVPQNRLRWPREGVQV